MTHRCDRIVDRAVSGDALDGADARHAEACPSCRATLRAARAVSDASARHHASPPLGLDQRLTAAVLGPRPSRSGWAIAGGLVVAAAAVAFAVLLSRDDGAAETPGVDPAGERRVAADDTVAVGEAATPGEEPTARAGAGPEPGPVAIAYLDGLEDWSAKDLRAALDLTSYQTKVIDLALAELAVDLKRLALDRDRVRDRLSDVGPGEPGYDRLLDEISLFEGAFRKARRHAWLAIAGELDPEQRAAFQRIDLAKGPPRPAPAPRPVGPASTKMGELLIHSRVPGEVFVDGRAVGVTPVIVEITPGRHHVKLRWDGYAEQVRVVHVERGKSVKMIVSPN